MKNLLKALIIVPVLALSAFLGYYWLDVSRLERLLPFLIICWASGHTIYKLFRVIDERYSRSE